MKKQLLLILSLMFTATIFAAPVTKQAAKKNVISFLKGRSGGKILATTAMNQAQLTEVDYELSGNAFYVFNFSNNGGFVIAAADDRVDPILGYSYEGSFDPQNVPVNMENWLKFYTKQINAIQTSNIAMPAMHMSDGSKKPYRHTIPVLMTTKWNQTAPYNNDCPKYPGDMDRRPTGCVATAMAQVVNYHKWPKEAIKAIPGYQFEDDPNLGGDGNVKKVDALPATTFDWDNMLDEYGYNADQQSKKAVAELMRYCGQIVNMSYHPWASGAFTFDIARGLRTYFNYDKGAKYIEHSGYTEAQWEEIVYNELVNNRPVLYSGAAEAGGHQFVCDGYENEYFHFNWGWGGVSDGYFKLNVLNPDQDGVVGGNDMNFSQDQSIVIGVQAPVEGSKLATQEVRIGSIRLTKNFDGKFKKNNLGRISIYLRALLAINLEQNEPSEVGFGLFNGNDELLELTKTETKWMQPGGYEEWKTLAYSVSVGSITKDVIANDGTYYLRPIIKYNNQDYQMMDNADNVYLELKVSGQDVQVTPYPVASAEFQNIHIDGTVYTQAFTEIKATVVNTGDDIEGVLYLTQDGKIEQGAADRIFMKKGEKKEVSLRFSPFKDGEHSFGLCINGNVLSDEVAVNVVKSETTGATLEINPQLNITSEGNYFDIPVEITNKSASKDYKSNIIATLYQKSGYSYIAKAETTVPVEIETSGKATINVHFDNLEFNKIYYLGFAHYQYGNLKIYGGTDKNGAPNKVFSKYKTADAISYFDAAGNMEYKVVNEGETFEIPATACYVNVPKNISGRTFVTSSNPNCIYNIRQGVSTAQFSDKNIAIMGRAPKLHLNNANSYFSADVISADQVTLDFTVDNAMTSVFLPFVPETVMAGDNELVKANSADELATADYALMPIVAEEEGKVYCEFDTTIPATAPSILVVKKELVGKVITFKANKVLIDFSKNLVKGSFYNLHASNSTEAYTDILGFGVKEFRNDITSAKPFSVYLTSISGVKTVEVVYPDGVLNTGIEEIDADMTGKMVSVYTIDGVKVRTAQYGDKMLEGLPSGLYIVNGHKFVK